MANIVPVTPDKGSGSGFGDMLTRRLKPQAAIDPRMKRDARAPGTRDYNEIDDKERASLKMHADDETGAAKGGLIKKVSGKPVGKDHGKIPAQVGEYVMKRAAVKKHGVSKMAAVNAGKAKIVPKKGKH